MEWIIESASTYAHDIDFIILVVAVLGGFWLILAEGVLFYFLFKFRNPKRNQAQYISGDKKEEKKWIHIPHNIIILCDLVIIVFAFLAWNKVKIELPPADETVKVIGQQWSWLFVHPGLDKQLGTADDVETVDELHLKVDTLYHYKLEAVDVLHSFSIPVFRLKQDAIPGRVITGWFKPTKTGSFDVQCAEMCGIGHGIMGGRVFIESAEDHEKWLRQHTTAGA